MASISVPGLKKRRRLWYAEKRIPEDVKDHFGKARFSKSLQTDNITIAQQRSEPLLQEWADLIKSARRKNKGEIVDLEERMKLAEKYFAEFGFTDKGLVGVIKEIGISAANLNDDKLVEAYGGASQQFTPILKHLEDWLTETGYAQAGEDEARNYFKKRFSKVFKHWESISTDELKAYVRGRQDGSDGERAWAVRTCELKLNLIKQYWDWMLDNDHITVPNLIDAPRLMKRKANTRKNREEANKDANLPYSISECWDFVDAAEKDGYNMLQELILLGMYTGCRIEELCALKLTDVGADYFQIQVGKTEASTRRIPIHSEIKQMVERLVQNSKDGYLLNGLSANNVQNKRSKAISKKFGHLKRGMGFEDRKHTFHSFRATFITRLMNAKADKTLTKKLVGHKGTDITYDLYAGEADWENKVELTELVKYPREVAG